MLLTDTAIRACKSEGKTIKLRDGGSLFLHVQPNGTKRFIMAYRWQGKQRSLALGVYPTISLKDARKRRDEARELIAAGVDPNTKRKTEKVMSAGGEGFSFSAMAERWFKFYKERRKEITARRTWMLVEKYVLPAVGRKDIRQITRMELVKLLDQIVWKGYRETAEKVGRIISAIFDDAVNRGMMEYSVAGKLCSVVPMHKAEHRAAILDREEFGRMMAAVDAEITMDVSVRFCLKMMAYVFVRHTELRCARWAEFDLAAGEWNIPAERMKGGRSSHFVPLARQAVELLRDLEILTGKGECLFPSKVSRGKPISDSAMRVALRRLGYGKEDVTVHGFRSTASTFLNELGYRPDIIERQLAHKDENAVRAAYNHAEFKDERIQMMQAWADYVDSLTAGHTPQGRCDTNE